MLNASLTEFLFAPESGRLSRVQLFHAVSDQSVQEQFKIDVQTYNLLMPDMHGLGLVDGYHLERVTKPPKLDPRQRVSVNRQGRRARRIGPGLSPSGG